MKFPNLDFDQLMGLYQSMSDEEKEQAKDLASKMMTGQFNPFGSMNPAFMQEEEIDEDDEEEEDEEDEEDEDEESFIEILDLDPKIAKTLSPEVLDALEAAVDLETFYEDVDDADLSASVLFYSKALLYRLREAYPDICTVPVPFTTLSDYFNALTLEPGEIGQIGERDRKALQSLISSAFSLQTRALSDRIGETELESLKSSLLESSLFQGN